jgi:hypothetical protein
MTEGRRPDKNRRLVRKEATFMEVSEAMELLRKDVSGYFFDDPTEVGIDYMREHYNSSKSHPKWNLVKSAFQIALERCSEIELNELVEHRFNRDVLLLPEGARGFLIHIYKSVFGTE